MSKKYGIKIGKDKNERTWFGHLNESQAHRPLKFETITEAEIYAQELELHDFEIREIK